MQRPTIPAAGLGTPAAPALHAQGAWPSRPPWPIIPDRGTAPALVDARAGDIQLSFDSAALLHFADFQPE